MNAPDTSTPEPKSPFPNVPNEPHSFERRTWAILVMTVACLLLGCCAPNAIFAHRIQRIVDNGGHVRSQSEYVGQDLTQRFGSVIYNSYRKYYVIRDAYDVFLGNTDRAAEPHLGVISLREASDDGVHRDPGDEGPKLALTLGRIQYLSLAETSVTDQGLAPLAEMTTLEGLDLSFTPIKGPGLTNLKGMNLKRLSLRSTALDDEGLAFLPHFPELFILDLGNTRASQVFLSRLSSYSKLQNLNLNGLPVTDEIVQQLSKLTLWRLDLGKTQITDASLPYLEKMSWLADLNLCGTKMSWSKVLESKHPAVQRWASIYKQAWRPGECEMR